MPFHSLRTIDGWLDEYRSAHGDASGALRIVTQDGEDGANTGLVVIALANAPTVTYIQPAEGDETKWVVTMEPREASVTLSSTEVRDLAESLRMVSDLCRFLEEKSRGFVGDDPA